MKENLVRPTYTGSCHCKALRFSFRSDRITRGVRCNCSICLRKGTVMSPTYIPPNDFESLEGTESLSVYRFGDRECNHYFCRICGVYPFHEPVAEPGHYRVNLGCLEDLDVLALPIEIIDGRSFPIRS
jgi:hypothetical protein